MNDKLDTKERKELPDSVFGLPEIREYPMPDAAHVRAAEAYFRYCPEELKMWEVPLCASMPTCDLISLRSRILIP